MCCQVPRRPGLGAFLDTQQAKRIRYGALSFSPCRPRKPWTGRRGVNRCQVIRTVVTPVSISDGEQPLARRPGISSRPAACRVSRLVTKQRRYSRGLSSHPCLSTARTAWPTAAPLPSPRPGSLDDHRISVPLSPPRRPQPPSAKRRTIRRRRCALPGGCRTGPLPFTSEAKQFIFVRAGLRVRPRFESRSVPARHVSSEVEGEKKKKRKGRDASGPHRACHGFAPHAQSVT